MKSEITEEIINIIMRQRTALTKHISLRWVFVQICNIKTLHCSTDLKNYFKTGIRPKFQHMYHKCLVETLIPASSLTKNGEVFRKIIF